MPFHHGLKFTESLEGARYVQERSQSILGLTAIAGDADVQAFPVNTPVLITDVRAALAKAGVEGTLAAALQAIADQTDPALVVIRVAEGEGEEAAEDTEANVIAGIELMQAAQAAIGVRPKILGAPGLDTQLVAAKLAEIAAKNRGFAYASAGGAGADTVAEAVTYRAQFTERELMLLYPNAKRGADVVQSVALAMGLRAAIDQAQGVHKTISNVPLRSVTGVVQALSWDFESMVTDAGVLNAANITALIHNTGYRFWGNRTCSTDAMWAFESDVRTNNELKDMIADSVLSFADKPILPSLKRDILETINMRGRERVRAGRLLGFEAWMEQSDGENSPAQLAAGQLRIRYRFTVPAPLEDLGMTVQKTDEFYADFAAR